MTYATHFLSRLLLETDAPYFRIGQAKDAKASHPGHALHVALCVAQLRKVDWKMIMKATSDNTKQLYNWGKSMVIPSFRFGRSPTPDLRSSDSRVIPVTARNADDDDDEDDTDDDEEEAAAKAAAEEEEIETRRKEAEEAEEAAIAARQKYEEERQEQGQSC